MTKPKFRIGHFGSLKTLPVYLSQNLKCSIYYYNSMNGIALLYFDDLSTETKSFAFFIFSFFFFFFFFFSFFFNFHVGLALQVYYA